MTLHQPLLKGLVLTSLILSACSGGGGSAGPTTKDAATGEAGASGPPVTCKPGTMSTVAGTSCVAVGPTKIPTGFAVSSDGWGFQSIRPAAPCTGATRGALGQTACAPIDDCNAAFPPPGAVVVRGGDSTALWSAINGAAPGSTVAVDSGLYTVTAKPAFATPVKVRIVGRCASQVVIQGAADNTAFGFTKGELSLESLTFRGFDDTLEVVAAGATADVYHVVFESAGLAAWADSGGKVTFRESVIDATGSPKVQSTTTGVLATNGSSVTVSDSEIRGSDGAIASLKGSHVSVAGTIMTGPGDTQNIFVLASWGSTVTIDSSVISVATGQVLEPGLSLATNMGQSDLSNVTVTRSEVLHTGPYFNLGFGGADGGATLDIEESTIRAGMSFGVSAYEAGSKVTLNNVAMVLRDMGPSNEVDGVDLLMGGSAQITGSAIVGARGFGVSVLDQGTRLTMTGSVVAGAIEAPAAAMTQGGPTTMCAGVDVDHYATASIEGSVISDNDQSGLVVGISALVDAQDVVVENTQAWNATGLGHGEGVTLYTGATIFLHASAVRGNGQVGLVAMRSSGVVDTTLFSDNAAGGVEVWETTVRQGSAGDKPAANELILADDTYASTGKNVIVDTGSGRAPTGRSRRPPGHAPIGLSSTPRSSRSP
jgi:hypothetical protein